MNHKWNEIEIDFLKKNYHEHGYKYCSDKLNIKLSSIKVKVGKLKLKLKDKTDITLFQNIK
jgi:hypothetical protein